MSRVERSLEKKMSRVESRSLEMEIPRSYDSFSGLDLQK